jgi:hypothetical protein
MARLLREPLLHLLLLGAGGVFATAEHLDRRTAGEPARIVLSQGQIEARPPPVQHWTAQRSAGCRAVLAGGEGRPAPSSPR